VTIAVEEVDRSSPELLEALQRLLPQLSSSASPPSAEQVEQMLDSSATTVLVARDADGRIVGTLTLALFRIPTGVRAWIEDVVVDERARGRGAGESLSREALRLAAEAGARSVDLTSRPEREAANRLYERLGFRRRETNVYRLELG
jgi:ribosomal protein S18 acetylase RimI-like enzyme